MSAGKKRRVVLLGSTGSIGKSTLRVAENLPELIEIVGLAAGSNIAELAAQATATGVKNVAIHDASKAGKLAALLPAGVKIHTGAEGLAEISQLAEADIVLIAIVGTAGLQPALAAIGAGKDLAVASKEILVMAGGIITARATEKGVRILPVDSEHNAIFQCLEGHRGPDREISRLILTASGGPFREMASEKLWDVTPEMAMKHPTWEMGPKITIDSATLFNKGLEMIEARWLFGIGMDRIEAVIHPQSIVHSMVEFTDGSVLAQLSRTDMGFPIQYALTYPARMKGALEPLDFTSLSKLEFYAPRTDDFPALNLARTAGLTGGTLPAVLNAANEVAVEHFRNGKIRFPQIWECVAQTMDSHATVHNPSLPQILSADFSARESALEWCLR
ncbi:1-deoxy-D-xylulose-5-phosphate reductoisomerase [Akkermansiaceae bacterium]|nr:1-deoxy-D-xylulose-5-phosphate reductoisomerase [Akkermansiaceae bacterium]